MLGDFSAEPLSLQEPSWPHRTEIWHELRTL